ncbi:MAG: hypothetical protein CSB13_07755 [Chloroflexi bacterium]|nr:MAG: hypothetical protein CSB13_07755 [Chloroflexota bacterium]
MEPPEIKPYLAIATIILGILMALGVLFTVMYLQHRPPDTSYTVNIEGQEIVVKPDPAKEVVIMPSGGENNETVIVEPTAQQIVSTDTPAPPPPPTSTPVPPTAVSQANMYTFVNHTVAGHDTLYSLARQHNTTIPLMARFGISSTELVVGNVLAIPVGNPAYCPGYRPYVVMRGDTPFGVSRDAGLSLEDFAHLNHLDANYSIYETQVVCIP